VILKLPYGRGAVTVDLRGVRCQPLSPSAPRAAGPVAGLVGAALDHPLDGPSLEVLARGRRRVTVLVPDGTRRIPVREVLDPVFARLGAAGVEPSSTTILVACGTHPPMPAAALAELREGAPPGVVVAQHDARDAGRLVEVGTTPGGLRIRLDRYAVDADLLLAVSMVQHHYFAGFGGGPKMVFPGVAGYEEVQHNHARVVDLSGTLPRRREGCEPGVLEGNPVAEEIAAAARLRPPDLALLLVAGADGAPAWAAAGHLGTSFPAACARVREWFEVAAGPFRRLVVSAGGDPVDATLIQAHKALDAACRFAAPGAEVLFVAACGEGAGSPEMEPFLADPRPEAIAARLAGSYVQYGHTTWRLVEKAQRLRISVVTELDDTLVRRLGLRREDPGQVVARWREGDDVPVAVMSGPPVYPVRR